MSKGVRMKASTERILTTHTGSLPRPEDLRVALDEADKGEISAEGATALPGEVREAVASAVRKQEQAGVDIVNDGEMSKIGYATYVKDRLTGFEGEDIMHSISDLDEYPEMVERVIGVLQFSMPACTGDIAYRGAIDLQADIDNLRAATEGAAVEDVFMSAASPGVISLFLANQHYDSHEAYIYALADAMKEEYDAIHAAGFVVQIDCPDLAMGRHMQFAGKSLEDFRRNSELHVEALNHAIRDVPRESVRIHLCWGNYDGPHHHDVPLQDVLDIVVRANVQAFLVEASNPRHEHEWKVFEDFDLPEGSVLVPGVVDSKHNYIEHPELVAERIIRFANVVGRENVIAGTDCGFGTFATRVTVEPRIAWAKLKSLSEGAELASRQLW
jgi:5-methyltetrahydropteroyltriglutamate--homocysteine methyltransferase